MLLQARQMAADFLGAARHDEIVFGPNMTSLTLHLSRSIARCFNPGDTLVVTRMDHDANITPWTLIAEDGGLNVEWVDFDVEDGTRGEGRTGCAQVPDAVGQFLGLAQATNRLVGQPLLFRFGMVFDDLLDWRRANPAGTDGVDANALIRILHGG